MAIGDFTLENGTVLPQVNIGYETWGTLNEARDNAILILHALTGDTHVSRGIPTSDMPAPSIRAVEVMVGGKVLWGRARWSILPSIL